MEPQKNLVEKIKFRGGENDFDKPLEMAHQICTVSLKSYDTIIFYFMSDGVWTYPERGIQLILNAQYFDKI